MKRLKVKYGNKQIEKKIIMKEKRKLNFLIILNISLFLIFLFLIKKYIDIKKKQNKIVKKVVDTGGFKYFCCFCVMGRLENRYAREVISYYLSIGFDKFVIADNNLPNTEKFSDVLQDYIKNDTVDIVDEFYGKYNGNAEVYLFLYKKYKNKCKWLTFFDFDEYLKMFSEDGKNIGIYEYLSNKKFDKCETVVVNWVMYGDNDLIYSDNRTTLERFSAAPLFNYTYNYYVKPIVRGDLNKQIFTVNKSHHTPNLEVITCDSMGNIQKNLKEAIKPPQHKYAYLMHFNTRSTEEYVEKCKRGYPGKRAADVFTKVKLYFLMNRFTEEKLQYFEKSFQRSFNSIRKIYNKAKKR